MFANETFFYIWLGARLLCIGLIVLFCLSQIEEAFIDLIYVFRRRHSRYQWKKEFQHITRETIHATPERPIAIVLPSSSEARYIERMLVYTADTLEYSNYTLFIGVNANDTLTQKAIAQAKEIYPNIIAFELAQENQTSESAYLCALLDHITAFEKEKEVEFELVLLHKPEHLLHPLSLKYLNALSTQHEIIQLPIYSLKASMTHIVDGAYMDQLAVFSSRDLFMSTYLTRSLPYSGAGLAFAREALHTFRQEYLNERVLNKKNTNFSWFDFLPNKLTKNSLYLNEHFRESQRESLMFTNQKQQLSYFKLLATQVLSPKNILHYIRIRENIFYQLLRRKERPLWNTSLRAKYVHYLAMKTFITSLLLPPAIALFGFWLYGLFAPILHDGAFIPTLIEAHEIYINLLIILAGCSFISIGRRTWCIGELYGPLHACLGIIRIPIGAFIQSSAAWNALLRYFFTRRKHALSTAKKPLFVWPNLAQLSPTRVRLGALLLHQNLISEKQLASALKRKQKKGKKLGEALIELGIITEKDLFSALAEQANTPLVELNPSDTPREVLELIPKSLAERYRVFPLKTVEQTLVFATDILDTDTREDKLSLLLGRPVEFYLCLSVDIQLALDTAYSKLPDTPIKLSNRLGSKLIRNGIITKEQLCIALIEQKKTGQKLGEVLLANKLLSENELEDVLSSCTT